MGYPEPKIAADRNRLPVICDRLVELCACEGTPPHHEVLDFFHLPHDKPCDRAAFETATAETARRGLQHRLALALVYGFEDEAIRLVDERGAVPSFDQAVQLAGAHAKRGSNDAAWATIETAWPDWPPLDLAQVAPTVLLTNRHLHGVVTAERARALLGRPRTAQWR